MRDAMRDPGVAKLALGQIKYLAKSGFLWCMTPSGRCIAYASPKLKDQVWAKLQLEDGSWSEAEVVEREEAYAARTPPDERRSKARRRRR